MGIKKFIIAILVVFSSTVSAKPVGMDRAHLQVPAPTKVEDLFKAAIKLGGFEDMCRERMVTNGVPCAMPFVVISTEYDEGAYGVFNFIEGPNTVILSAGHLLPGTLSWNATLVHEFTHYLQFIAGTLGPAQHSCSNMKKIELEAYDVASKYLATQGVKEDFVMQRGIMEMNEMYCIVGGGKP